MECSSRREEPILATEPLPYFCIEATPTYWHSPLATPNILCSLRMRWKKTWLAKGVWICLKLPNLLKVKVSRVLVEIDGDEYADNAVGWISDQETRNIIDKLANFVARNGPEFEQMTMNKQQRNPKFGFLFSGNYHTYYKWKVGIEQGQL